MNGKSPTRQVRIKFLRLLPYHAAILIFCALIGSYHYQDYFAWIWLLTIIATPILTKLESKYFILLIHDHGIEVRRFWWSFEVENGTCFKFYPFWFSPVVFPDNKNFDYSRKSGSLPNPLIVDEREAYESALKRLIKK